jgi:uncharacterized protein (DUF433 family)
MSKMITEIIDNEPYEYIPLGDYVVKAKGVCGGRPTFKYTRILIAGTLDRIDGGEDIDSIVEGYRGCVSKDTILEARRIWNSLSKREA